MTDDDECFFPPLAGLARTLPEAPIELVGLVGDGYVDSGFGRGFAVSWTRPLDADERRRLLGLIAALPNADSMRCHLPPFGLRCGDVEVSICFRCYNAYAGDELLTFDGSSTEALALLAFLRERAPAGWSSPE
jgi:hypothetical protein